jgi:hypothetical protein
MSESFFQCKQCRAIVADSAPRLSVDTWVFSDGQFARLCALSCVYAHACYQSDDMRVERLSDTSGMTLRGLLCVACNSTVGRVYVSSGEPRFDWQRGVFFLDARAVTAHVVAVVRAPQPTAALSFEAPADVLASLVENDQKAQVIFQGLQRRVEQAVDAVGTLEQRLVDERLVPRAGTWKCTVAGCRESFTREHRLRRHERVAHGKAGRVTCAAMFCVRDFADAAEMEAHMLDAHSDVVERNRKRVQRRSLSAPHQPV